MLRSIFLILLFAHGLIHLMGFAKAFNIGDIKELSLPISKPTGLIWLSAFILFIAAGSFFVLRISNWWVFAIIAVLVSQVLIFYFWSDAKVGTIANIIILLVSIIGFGTSNFEKSFNRDVIQGLDRTNNMKVEVVTQEELQHLPLVVQKYLNYVGVIGKPKIRNIRLTMKGEMRSKEQSWFNFTSEQFNFFDVPSRFFFMKAKVKGLPTAGYHSFKNGKASMIIKLLSLFPASNVQGEEMDISETVTYFNDLCLFAPGRLIDENIEWEELDDTSVKAIFTNNDIRISAILEFNNKGQLINFFSEDRYEVNDMKKYRFSTPISNYKNFNGYNLCSYGEAIWHYPEGKFVYGKFWRNE